MPLINLTPHDVVLFTPTETLRLPAAEHPARILDSPIGTTTLADVPVPVVQKALGMTIDNLPALTDGVYYVVSRAVAMAAPGRPDLLVPGTLRTREDGTTGCRELFRFHR